MRRYQHQTASRLFSSCSSSLRQQSAAAAATTPLDQQTAAQERATLWGATSGTFITPGESTQEFLARTGYDPVLSSASFSSATSTHQEDGLGTNLNHSSQNVAKDSETLMKTERGSQFLSALRRTRARGAGSSVGFARISNPRDATDEADRAETTWNRDSSFLEISAAVNEVTGVSASNMETLVTAIKRATPEQLVQLYTNFRGLQPYSYLPVPSEAGWALSGEDLSKWCEKVNKARSEADQFNADVLNNAVVAASGWASIAGKLADQYKKLAAVETTRRERQIKAGLRKEWSKMTLAEKEVLAAQDVARLIQSEQTGEFDSAGNEDTSEEFLLEHEQIEKIIDEDIGGGVTYRKFWMHNERFLEAVNLQHIADMSSADLRAACLLRARDELGFDQLNKDLEQSIRSSTFDNRGHFVAPDMSSRGWRMTRWHLFGASKTVVQHATSSSRILDCHFQTLEGTAATARLYYRLLPLSSSLDLSSPFRHRKSLVTVAAEFLVDIDRSNQTRAVAALQSIDSTVKSNEQLVKAIGAPFGAARRVENEQLRKDLTKNDVPLTNISFDKSSSSSSWKMGTFREVKFDWNTPLLDAHDPQITSVAPGTVDAALLREKLRQQRTCISVALMKKRSKEDIEKAKQDLEMNIVSLINSNKNSSTYELILRQIQRITTSSSSSLEQSISLLKKEIDEQQQWEFVTMLDDSIQPYPGDTSFKVRMPVLNTTDTNNNSDEYRLDVRCFDLHANPKRLPTRYVTKSSPSFKIESSLVEIVKKAGKIKNVEEENFNGNLLVDVCAALRKEGIEVPLMLEFEAGQNLTAKGEVDTKYFLSLFNHNDNASSTQFFFKEMSSNRGISDIQLSIEPAVRKHYEVHHPGCTEQEWAENRRSVLETALQEEFEWWRQDSLLHLAPEILSPVASPSAMDNTHPGLQSAATTLRYGRDVVQVLHATGRDGKNQDDASAPIARVSVRGDGATVSLDIDQNVCANNNVKLDKVLQSVIEASDAAVVRLNTLAQAKIGHTQHSVNRLYVDIADGTDLGGIYSKTVVKAFAQAESQIEKASGNRGLLDQVVRKDDDVVDRFASKDNAELRIRTMASVVGSSGENPDADDHNAMTPW